MSKYRKINTELNRQYRNDLNHNFDQIDEDIKSTKNEIKRVEIETKETIDGIVGGGFIEGLEAARDNANAAANNANSKATYADGRGKYANTQGDYAKEQGDYAKLKGDYANDKAILADEAAASANAEASNLDGLKVDVVDATQSANTAASNANSKAALANTAATNANTKADLANAAASDAADATSVINQVLPNVTNLENAKTYINSKQYFKNNIVEFNGSSFMALEDTKGIQPPTLPTKENASWILLAQRGVDGNGAVGSVNGVLPDVNGDVKLTDVISAKDVSELPQGYPIGSTVMFIANDADWKSDLQLPSNHVIYMMVTTFKTTSANGYQEVTTYYISSGNDKIEKFRRNATNNGWGEWVKSLGREVFNAHVNDRDNPHNVTSEQLNVIELPKVTDFPTEYKNGVSVTFFASTSENGTGWVEGIGYEGSAARYGIITTFKTTSSNGFQKVVLYNLGGSAFEEFTRTATTTSNRWSPFRKSVTSDDFIKGVGDPEGTVTAPKGTLYLRTDGGADTTLYIKTSGSGNAGWTAK